MKVCSPFLPVNLLVAVACSAAIAIAEEEPKKSPQPAVKATDKSKTTPTVKLTDAGEALRVRYAEMHKAAQAEIAKSLPVVDEGKKAALENARKTLQTAIAEESKTQQSLAKIQQAKGLVEHAKGKWIRGAEQGIAQALAALKKASTDAERQAAMASLAKWQANKEDGIKALHERQAALDKLKIDEPKLLQAAQAAKAALAQARTDELTASEAILADLKSLLSSDTRDAALVKAVVLTEATPLGLAQFAQQGNAPEAIVDKLLANPELMKEMLVAGGATNGQYGQAMQIFSDIQKASSQASKGILYRLAVATSLAHAVPIAQRNAVAEMNAPAFVDPVKRYLHYEKAFLNGELDPAFPTLTTWECRFVVDSFAPDEMLTWGREMLRNYRPDHILNPDYGWRYSGAVRTDVAYRHSQEYQDTDTLGFFQNVCKNGGICGRRAFFGRFIVQAFGLPARPFTQPAHAALVRWTPKGWVVNLGASWPHGWFPEQSGPDFLLETQARRLPRDYMRVLRAEWMSKILGEPQATNNKTSDIGMWKQLALMEKKLIVAAVKPEELAALGSELAEANESEETKAAAIEKAAVTLADKKIAIEPSGVITIPAAACGGGNHLVKSFLGGLQMICGGKPITCVVEVPRGGKYSFSARVVTVHGDQTLPLTLNNAEKPIDVRIPFTVGMWQNTQPVEVTLVEGKNTLTLGKPIQAFALKDLTLTPTK